MKPIITLTLNPSVDKSTAVSHVVPDRKLRCTAVRLEPGGGGINVARAISRLGEPAIAVYIRGGTNGDRIEALLRAEEVMTRPIPISGECRESLMIHETETGQQYRFSFPGPALVRAEWSACLAAVDELSRGSDYIVASGSLPPDVPDDFYVRLHRTASNRGVRMILDTSGSALAAPGEQPVFLIKPNLREFESLVGHSLVDDREIEVAARRIIDSGIAEHLVVSMGAAGVAYATSSTFERIPAPTVRIESRVGAGDSTVAGIATGLARGLPVAEAVRLGVAAGAAAVMTAGSELCRRENVDALYRGMAKRGPSGSVAPAA